MAMAPPNFGVNLDDSDDARQAATAVLILLYHFQRQQVPRIRQLVRTNAMSGQGWVDELLEEHCIRMLENMHMNMPTFVQLCRILRERGYITEGSCDKVTLEEGVAVALYGDCIGAIDGTHVSANVSREEQDAFRNRKGTISQNILAVSDHNMKFVYVRTGWEDSAHDSRVLLDAISNPSAVFSVPPVEKYYVVDAAYRHMPGFMAPFKSGPGGRSQTAQKGLFNRRHSSVRNIIERTFGV
ncbi:protein ANTAGONIST OF LIKE HETEROCHROMATIN PROTEIN 1-like [Coffea arabica]|uniref:Protein ANTAGONIST OF LIKE HETEROCHROMATIN PROTEIN 1-like n=1 Tax=Coffea arabica TaxID=13443 RepID=A0ABM4WQ34_COFAR